MASGGVGARPGGKAVPKVARVTHLAVVSFRLTKMNDQRASNELMMCAGEEQVASRCTNHSRTASSGIEGATTGRSRCGMNEGCERLHWLFTYSLISVSLLCCEVLRYQSVSVPYMLNEGVAKATF